MRTHRILFLGGGSMAASIIDGILSADLIPPSRIHVIGRDRGRLSALQSKYGTEVSASGEAPRSGWDAVILAVPPQALSEAIAANRASIPQEALILSVCAGISIASIQELLGHGRRIIRVMPNTLGATGYGCTAICASAEARAEDLSFADSLFSAIGSLLPLPEDRFDAFTAFSCSGPAYFYAFVEAMTEAGEACGFDRETSEKMVLENLSGVSAMLQRFSARPAELVRGMSTPGGVTAAATRTLLERDLAGTIRDAVKAAERRSRELGN